MFLFPAEQHRGTLWLAEAQGWYFLRVLLARDEQKHQQPADVCHSTHKQMGALVRYRYSPRWCQKTQKTGVCIMIWPCLGSGQKNKQKTNHYHAQSTLHDVWNRGTIPFWNMRRYLYEENVHIIIMLHRITVWTMTVFTTVMDVLSTDWQRCGKCRGLCVWWCDNSFTSSPQCMGQKHKKAGEALKVGECGSVMSNDKLDSAFFGPYTFSAITEKKSVDLVGDLGVGVSKNKSGPFDTIQRGSTKDPSKTCPAPAAPPAAATAEPAPPRLQHLHHQHGNQHPCTTTSSSSSCSAARPAENYMKNAVYHWVVFSNFHILFLQNDDEEEEA